MDEPKPGIDRLLVRSALDAELRRRLLDAPDQVFPEFDLSEEEKELLRKPDHRLLPLLGSLLARQEEVASSSPESPPHALIHARTLPDISLAVTVVPCVRTEGGEPAGYSYAVWVNPLPEGMDPAQLPLPAGAELPGPPMAPLRVVMQISAIEVRDGAGQPQVGLSASLRQFSNIVGPVPQRHRAALVRSEAVEAATAAVRSATRELRYGRLIDLIRALQDGGTR